MKSHWLHALLLGATAGLFATGAAAQSTSYPHQMIKIVVPYPAGGATDSLARMIATKLHEAWGQSVIVDNKPGASGTIGNAAVAKAAPDGYTVLLGITAIVQAPPLMPNLPYDVLKDLQPVTEVARASSVFAVPTDSPAANLKDFVALVKANPSKYNFGSYGAGTSSHIQGALLNLQAGLDMAHVPYKGAAPLVNDLLGGQLTAAFVDSATASPHLKSGKFKVLAVTGANRNKLLPDVPTFQELGYHSFEPYGWFGLFMPAGVPADVLKKFSAEAMRVLGMPDVVARIEAMGLTPVGNTPEEFARTVKNDAALYAKIIKDTKITLQ
ncbi:MAG TPA: tripartite tricarboxylate transporter substrate binding protein [Burkholderiaceae bacterium]|nr:tripartite tricarboxylate transporter substrate binding protein [Burkholderiaceae bacterium]